MASTPKPTSEARIEGQETAILEAILAGYTSPAQIAEHVFLSTDPELVSELRRLLSRKDFNQKVQQAREDVIGTALDSFKRDVLRQVQEMKELATTASDARIRYQASKDILDRVVGPASQKIDLRYTPSSYLDIVKEYEKDNGDTTSDGPAEVVPKAELPAKERSEGS